MKSVKGKWSQGIKPRNFVWVIKDQLAASERPGGYGQNHRRVRRQEEIIWIREQGFSRVISLIPSTHNLHNYDELGVEWLHRPFAPREEPQPFMAELFGELRQRMRDGERLLIHQEEFGDRLAGLLGGYLIWSGLVASGPRAISIIERIRQRQLGPTGRELIAVSGALADA